MKTPNITTAQIIGAIFGAVYPVLTLIGVNLNPEQVNALQELNVVAVGLFGADAAIRVGRSVAASKGSVEAPIDEFVPGDLSAIEAADADRLEASE